MGSCQSRKCSFCTKYKEVLTDGALGLFTALTEVGEGMAPLSQTKNSI